MISRRVIVLASVAATAVFSFALGVIHAQYAAASVRASYDARIDAVRDEILRELMKDPRARVAPTGTAGHLRGESQPESDEAATTSRDFGPETRTTATPDGGLPLDSAKIVSGNCIAPTFRSP